MEIRDLPYLVGLCAGLSVLLLTVSGCASPHQAPQIVPQPAERPRVSVEQAPEPIPGVIHEVKPGQTLWRIAHTYGVPVEELARVNGIDDVTQIKAGSVVFVPGVEIPLEIRVPPGAVTPEATADLVWPVADGRILSHFGAPRRTHRHAGIDIHGREGQPVLAALSGKVIYSDDRLRGYGKTVILDHGNGLRTLYAHNSKVTVRRGDRVKMGQTIARVGRTGNATAEHCHFEIRKNEVPVDPLLYLTPEIGTD